MININRINQNNEYSLGKPEIQVKRANIETRETRQTTGDVGKMIPIAIKEMLPSEFVEQNTIASTQFMPFVTNLMHEMRADIVTAFCPYRLIWEEWEQFSTGCDEEKDITDGTLEPEIPNWNAKTLLEEIGRIRNPARTGTTTNSLDIEKNQRIWRKIILGLRKEIGENITGDLEYWLDWVENPKNTLNYGYYASTALLINDNFNNNGNFWTFKKTGDTSEYIVDSDSKKELILAMNNLIDQLMVETLWDYYGLPLKDWLLYKLIGLSNDKINWRKLGSSANKWTETEIAEIETIANERFVNKLNFRCFNKYYNDWIRKLDWEPRRNLDDLSLPNGNWAEDMYTRARKYAVRGQTPSVPVEVKNILGTEGDGDWQIADMMTASAILNFYMSNARVKPRYSDQLYARWGVVPEDSRFQYAQFVKADSIDITQNGIIQTAPQVGDSTSQGNITGQMWANGASTINFRAPEHGALISFIIIRPANVYEQGIPKLYQHVSKFDYAVPELVDLPDEAINITEITPYAKKKEGNYIGYKSIYDEYRTKINIVTGLLRPTLKAGLGAHTLARVIQKNQETTGIMEYIVKCIPDMKRVKMFINEPDFMLTVGTVYKMSLPLPYISNPKITL